MVCVFALLKRQITQQGEGALARTNGLSEPFETVYAINDLIVMDGKGDR